MARRLVSLCAIALLLLLVDQVTKIWAVDRLTRAFEVEGAISLAEKGRAYLLMRKLEPMRRKPVVLVEDHLAFRYVENPGAAWGILGDLDAEVRLPFFRFMPLLAMALVLGLYLRAGREQRLLRFSLILIFGGALGNLADRWIRGYVVDFIAVSWGDATFPVFNVADVAISVGLVGMVAETVLARRRRPAKEGVEGVEPEALPEGEASDETLPPHPPETKE